VVLCPHCDAEAPDGSRFCPSCAARLDATTAVATESGLYGKPPREARDQREAVRFIPGTIIDGRYRIVGQLGRGGMGEVYRADDLKLGQPVALKFLPADVAREPERLELFLNEVRTAHLVSHANVCRVHDIGEIEGQHYISMEYVDGEDLGSLLRRIGRLPGGKAVQIARQLCAGLAAAHEQGVLHRDLKPANVMIDGRGRAKITDFGLAGLAETISGDEIRAGTPLYMAPEQSRGQEVSIRSDIYSLGLVLYELFTGRRAFDAETQAELDRMREQSTPTNPSHHVRDLDAAVERIIMRCLESDPAGRPASALEVAASLPGGDPLAAALAAGETPSPQMVADADAAGGLHPFLAVALLVFVVGGLITIAAIRDRYAVEGLVPLPKPPEALVVEAREIIELAGHRREPLDHDYGFIYDEEYLDAVAAQEPTSTAWSQLSTVRPAPILFWYRESPQRLIASGSFLDDDDGYVSPSRPPWTVAAMAGVWLDPEGRLLRLKVVPPEFTERERVGSTVDWTPFFNAAGFEAVGFRSTIPGRNPLITCDERYAWEGTDEEAGQIRIEACSFAGSAAHFEVIPSWRLDGSSREAAPSSVWNAIFFSVMLFALVVGGAVLARRNLRLGRGDRRGALRVAGFVFFLLGGAWVLRAHHVPTFAEIGLAADFVGIGLVVSGTVWLVYIALEPHARRLWPNGLVSWSRLITGRYRDPLVGRDLLIGAAAGVFTACWWGLYDLILDCFDLPKAIRSFASLNSLSGIAETIGQYFELLAMSLYLPVAWLFAVLLLRVILRRQVIAVVVLILFAVGTWVPYESNPLLFAVFAFVAFAVFLVLLLRVGLLAALSWSVYMWASDSIVFTLDAAAWYVGRSWFTMLLLAALAGYGFRIATLGRPLVGDQTLAR
jgi:serine/threonine-protein kinase